MEEGLSDPSRRKTEKVTRPRWVVRTPLKGWRSTFEGRGKERRDWNGSGATNALKYLKELCAGKKERDGCAYLYFVWCAGAHGKRGLLMNWR